MILSIALVLASITQTFAGSPGDTSLTTVQNAFDAANIPADSQLTFNPTTLLEVAFPEPGAPAIDLSAGEQLPRNATAGPPTFGILAAGSTANPGTGPFVVAAVDLDAPTPQHPTSAQIRHFLGGNFVAGTAGADGVAPLANSTPALSEFLQPTPPAGSDPHRYVFLLFDQPAGFENQTFVTPSTSIMNFNISLFAQEVGLGNPLGGTFMLVGPDPTAT